MLPDPLYAIDFNSGSRTRFSRIIVEAEPCGVINALVDIY
jgi:hypothetical protein